MLKKEILTVFKLAILVLPFLVSCAAQKEFGKNGKVVTIELFNADPYCGGVMPDVDMVIPFMNPLANYTLLLYLQNEDGTRGKEIKELVTDENGRIRQVLPSGIYQLWHPSKKLSLEEFIKIQSPDKGQFYIYKGKECFLAWKERADFTFEILSDTTIRLQYNNRCYTGAHPCLDYDGPYYP